MSQARAVQLLPRVLAMQGGEQGAFISPAQQGSVVDNVVVHPERCAFLLLPLTSPFPYVCAGEAMISGVTGEEFAAEIFIGPVFYQRLRHMVSDKFQVWLLPSCPLLFGASSTSQVPQAK